MTSSPAASHKAAAKPAMPGDSEASAAFERSRLVALFCVALLVPALLVLDGPRDWRLALLVSTPTLPLMVALLLVRSHGAPWAFAAQFGVGVLSLAALAASGFGFAVPALIFALMLIDGLLVNRAMSRSPVLSATIAGGGLAGLMASAFFGSTAAPAGMSGLMVWLVLPSLVQLGTAIVVWRTHATFRRKSDQDPSGILHRSVDRAQREVGALLDGQGRVDDVTGNMRDVMGLRASDAMGRGLIDRLHVLDRPNFLKAIAEAAGDSTSTVLRLRFNRLDASDMPGTFRWFEGRVSPVSGHQGAALMMVRDIHDEMAILTADADRRLKAEEERRGRAAFLADLSHDVRTPLNAIIGFSELLSNPMTQPREPARITEYADIVHRSGRDLLEVVTLLVEMTRLENGAFEFIEEVAKPQDLLDGLRETLAEAIERPDFALKRKGHLDVEWLVDRRAIRQVLFGIGSTIIDQNAAADLCVTVACNTEDIRFHFSICDEDSSKSAGRRTVTAGISTEVAKALVALMGGTIIFEDGAQAVQASLSLPLGGRGQDTAGNGPAMPVNLSQKRIQKHNAVALSGNKDSKHVRMNHG
jgi:two-component system, cell cycle sensor histidine kinase DivJ